MRKPGLYPVLLAIFCLASTLAASGQTLLVVNQGDADVSLINPASGRRIATIDENLPGVHGHEVTASPDGHTAFVPIYGSSGVGLPGIDGHQILVIDLPSRKIVGHIDFGHGVRPHFPLFDPSSGLLYVTTELTNSVAVIDPKTRKIVGSIPTGQPQSHMLAISHDGKRGYTANVGPGTVSVLDLARRKTIAVIPVSGKVQRISISADDKLVFTSDQTRPQLVVIDTASDKVKARVPLPGLGYGTAATHDSRWLLVAIPSANKVAVVDLKTMRLARDIDVPSGPQEILIRPDGKVAYVSCAGSRQVAAINLMQWKVTKKFTAGTYPDGLAWAR